MEKEQKKINLKKFVPHFQEIKAAERHFNNLLSDKQRNNSFILKHKKFLPNKNQELEIIRKRAKTIKDNCYDKNRDGTIGFDEYQQFITEMLISMGRTKVQSKLIFTYFERADNDNSGIIEKEEFKKEFKKRLREFYMMNV